MRKHIHKLNGWPAAALAVALLAGTVAYGASTHRDLSEETAIILEELALEREKNLSLLQTIKEREEVINNFQGQINKIGNTVGVLQKLSQTDEELLKKYSKVYFLNENYIPAQLREIDKTYVNVGSTNTLIHAEVWPRLERLLNDAHSNGHIVKVASAFRSFATQSSLKTGYTSVYGTGANKFSADQGYSEHQLGTAVDFTTDKLGAAFNSFASDPAYQWLRSNAHNYGFILSYPPNNAYYQFEPWHWRYVGVELATELHDGNRNFYDLEQREIDEYLIKLFD